MTLAVFLTIPKNNNKKHRDKNKQNLKNKYALKKLVQKVRYVLFQMVVNADIFVCLLCVKVADLWLW